MAVGHFYSLDLRSHALRHLAVGEGPHLWTPFLNSLCPR